MAHSAFAQFNYVIDQSIPVNLQDETVLSMPWTGGLNATQFNTIDLNGDGKDDLAIFDRTASRVVTFINDNNTYRYAPEYEPFFPEVSNWMLLRDFNGDGRKDIFTSDNQDIRVYTNATSSGETLTWKLFYFTTGFGSKSDVLLSMGLTTKINVHMNADDLPAISDADGDGDLDLFVPRYPSGSTIEFHKNLSVENYGTLDSLDFVRTPQTPQAWGGVTECDCGAFAFHDQPCNTGGKIDHAGGKSLFAFDVDQDGDQDMLLSESECNQLFLLRNDGTNAAPVINQAVSFPAGSPAVMATYPTPFYEDVNFDNKKDLIVTPNIVAREFLQTNLRSSVWFYRNTGSTGLPVFAPPQTNFLQGNMIDVGDNAVPAFFDADGDSDLDLFVACYTFNFSGTIFYYENTGTQFSPSYKLVTTDFIGISFLNFTNIKPSFADMNGDTKIDLVFTASNQAGGNTQLYYLSNNSGIGLNLSTEVISTNFSISSPENICLADV
ncbi:MAG TPA: VCBS repeat-containing protein, partial [Cyclobacteriaceae bacterium]